MPASRWYKDEKQHKTRCDEGITPYCYILFSHNDFNFLLLMPTIASPKSSETSAITAGLLKLLDRFTIAAARLAGSPDLKCPSLQIPPGSKPHHQCCIGVATPPRQS